MVNDKRRERRFTQRNFVRIRPPEGPGDFFFMDGIPAETVDISLGGARVRSDVPFRIGDTLRMHVELAGPHQTVSIEGIVRWVRKEEDSSAFQFGVEFHDLLPRTVLTLMRSLFDESNACLRTVLT